MAKTQLAQQQSSALRTTALGPRSAKKPSRLDERLPKSNGAKVNRLSRKQAPVTPVNPVIQLIQKHPLLMWSGVLAAILFVCGVAIMGLTNPGHLEKEQLSEIDSSMTTQNAVPATQDGSGGIPLWLLGLVAVSSVAGSWVVIKQLKGSPRRRKLRKPLKSRSSSRQPVGQQRQTTASSPNRTVPSPKRIQKPPSPKPGGGRVKPKPPLNTKEDKFLNSIDLRKSQPLSSVLRIRKR